MHAFPDINHPDLSIDQLADTVIEHCKREDSAVLDGLSYIADLDNRSGHSHWGSASCAEWLTWKCDMARSTAMERVRVAHRLKALPQIEAAFRCHDISYSKVRSLTRVATPATEAAYLDRALDRTAAQLDREISRIRNADVDASMPDAWRQIEGRHVSLYVRDDGAGVVNAELPGNELEVLRQALEFVSSELPEVRGQSPQKRQACALVQMARDALAGRTAQGKAGDHYQVVVHVDETALKGEGGQADLPVETVRRVCCDGSVVPMVTNAMGEPLDVGRKQRTIPPAIKRVIEARDRTCRFPGCSHERWLDGHHVKHWALGGETKVGNLVHLCHFHHALVHEGGWSMRFTANGDAVYFVRPDGSPLEVDEHVATVRLTPGSPRETGTSCESPRENCGDAATERSDPSPRETD